ncbi:hypothetical protein F5887DRAFT_914446 [Amanita rubescens]|nr:hypothetical protein F5887DRAFT_914446 [Amanita rubescens]
MNNVEALWSGRKEVIRVTCENGLRVGILDLAATEGQLHCSGKTLKVEGPQDDPIRIYRQWRSRYESLKIDMLELDSEFSIYTSALQATQGEPSTVSRQDPPSIVSGIARASISNTSFHLLLRHSLRQLSKVPPSSLLVSTVSDKKHLTHPRDKSKLYPFPKSITDVGSVQRKTGTKKRRLGKDVLENERYGAVASLPTTFPQTILAPGPQAVFAPYARVLHPRSLGDQSSLDCQTCAIHIRRSGTQRMRHIPQSTAT